MKLQLVDRKPAGVYPVGTSEPAPGEHGGTVRRYKDIDGRAFERVENRYGVVRWFRIRHEEN